MEQEELRRCIQPLLVISDLFFLICGYFGLDGVVSISNLIYSDELPRNLISINRPTPDLYKDSGDYFGEYVSFAVNSIPTNQSKHTDTFVDTVTFVDTSVDTFVDTFVVRLSKEGCCNIDIRLTRWFVRCSETGVIEVRIRDVDGHQIVKYKQKRTFYLYPPCVLGTNVTILNVTLSGNIEYIGIFYCQSSPFLMPINLIGIWQDYVIRHSPEKDENGKFSVSKLLQYPQYPKESGVLDDLKLGPSSTKYCLSATFHNDMLYVAWGDDATPSIIEMDIDVCAYRLSECKSWNGNSNYLTCELIWETKLPPLKYPNVDLVGGIKLVEMKFDSNSETLWFVTVFDNNDKLKTQSLATQHICYLRTNAEKQYQPSAPTTLLQVTEFTDA